MEPHRFWRVTAIALAVALLVAVNVVVWLQAARTREASDGTAGQTQTQLNQPTATVELNRLVETMLLRCRFEAADVSRHTLSASLPLLGTPIVTSVHVAVGDTLAPADVPLTVAGRPVIVLSGSFPAFRDLRRGDVGTDVEQLQEALLALQLGADGVSQQGVSGIVDEQTVQLVDELYRQRGFEPARVAGDAPDLVLPAAEVAIVGALPSTIVDAPPEVGSALAPDTPMFVVSSSRLVLACPLSASQEPLLEAGLAVVVDTGDASGSQLSGVTERPYSGNGNIDLAFGSTFEAASRVRILLTEDVPASLLGSTARAHVRIRGSEDAVLSVPSTALVAHSDGTNSVTVLTDSGSGVSIGVTVGVSAGGWVAVEGDGIKAGDIVLLGEYAPPEADDAGTVGR